MTTTGLTRPIPAEALPVVKLIRERVPRPKKLPVRMSIVLDAWALRFVPGRGPGKQCCPLGLDETAQAGAPEFRAQFPEDSPFYEVGSLAIMEFGEWWDGEQNAQAACDAVWGE